MERLVLELYDEVRVAEGESTAGAAKVCCNGCRFAVPWSFYDKP